MRLTLPLCVFLLLVAAPSASASADRDYQHGSISGEIGVDFVTLKGDVVSNIQGPLVLRGLALADAPATWSWTIDSESAIVNWTHVQMDHYGNSPAGGDSSVLTHAHEPTYGELAYNDFFAQSRVANIQASLLVVLDEDSWGTADVNGDSSVQTSDDREWRIGYERDADVGAGNNVGATHVQNLPSRSPSIANDDNLMVRTHGNATIYIWGGDVDASSGKDGSHAFRTGAWTENDTATPLHQQGAVREEHTQVLRITATNATLDLKMDQGTWEWTQPEIAVALDGTFETPKAEGQLESLTHEYPVEGEPLRMDGRLDLNFRQAQVGDSLRVDISSPATTIEGPEGVALDSGAGVFAAPTAASFVAGAASLVLIAPVAAVFLVGHVRNRRMSAEAHLTRAEEAIVELRPRVARRHAWWLRRKRDGDADVDGWFLHAASLAQQKKYGRILREIPPVLDGVAEEGRASLAFLLIIACQKEDRPDDARHYAAIAVEDPVVRERVLVDPMFADVRDVVPRPDDEPSGLAAYT